MCVIENGLFVVLLLLLLLTVFRGYYREDTNKGSRMVLFSLFRKQITLIIVEEKMKSSIAADCESKRIKFTRGGKFITGKTRDATVYENIYVEVSGK